MYYSYINLFSCITSNTHDDSSNVQGYILYGLCHFATEMYSYTLATELYHCE